MHKRTRQLWEKQQALVGERSHLFTAVANAIEADEVLYPGSYVDITPSSVWPSVTYVDTDRRANQFFSDEPGVESLLHEVAASVAGRHTRFIHNDYSVDLGLEQSSFDLLISLYAGFVSEHCTKYLRKGGHLLVNPSHGDAAMASIDSRYALHGVLLVENSQTRVDTTELNSYLIPKRRVDVTVELLHQTGRQIEYTKSPFAYLFRRIG